MHIQTQYFFEQFYMELGGFEDILGTSFKAGQGESRTY